MDLPYKEITDLKDLALLVRDLQHVDSVAIDTETSSTDPFLEPLILFQICANNNIYVIDARKHLNIITYLVGLVKDSKKLAIFHNAVFDLEMIYTATGEMLVDVYDTMLGEILLYQGLGNNFPSLKDLVKKYCGVELNKDVRETFIDFSGEFSQEQLLYSALDVRYLLEIKDKQSKLLEEQRQTRVIDLECKLAPVIATMQLNGITLDKDYWLSLAKESEISAIEWEKKVKQFILDRIPYSRYNNLYELLEALKVQLPTFEEMGGMITPIKKVKKVDLFKSITDLSACRSFLEKFFEVGSSTQMLQALRLLGINIPDTNAKTLKRVDPKSKNYEVISLLLDYRESDKSVSSFGENYFKYINPVTGRIHTSYHQLGTFTGRMSSSNPNLQQVPREQKYRKSFIARPGYKLISADFSQQEYRLAGAVFREPAIIEAYKKGMDMHTMTACILYNKSPDQVTKEERSRAKSVNFAVLYGSTEYGLAYNLQIPIEEAKKLLDAFFAGYPVLAKAKELAIKKILENYYSVTLTGRRRYWEHKTIFGDYKEMYRYEGSIAREGFNHIIQGTGADVTKLSLINLYYNNPFGDAFRILLQVHDEIICEVREDLAEEGAKFVVASMKSAFQPFLGEIEAEVSVDIGDYWVH